MLPMFFGTYVGGHEANPVSYTHLDVYKRQDLRHRKKPTVFHPYDVIYFPVIALNGGLVTTVEALNIFNATINKIFRKEGDNK